MNFQNVFSLEIRQILSLFLRQRNKKMKVNTISSAFLPLRLRLSLSLSRTRVHTQTKVLEHALQARVVQVQADFGHLMRKLDFIKSLSCFV